MNLRLRFAIAFTACGLAGGLFAGLALGAYLHARSDPKPIGNGASLSEVDEHFGLQPLKVEAPNKYFVCGTWSDQRTWLTLDCKAGR